ncbi:hypothetical protein [Acinetobacter sp. RW6]|uniref:hypothetical protein n=1 Tax=Acinetobacter sp. RW6 TaxID=3242680 RepID=UPI0035C190B7
MLEKIKKASLADWVLIISSGLLITGLCYQFGYYGNIGLQSPWIINLLGTKELFISNLGLCILYAIAALYLSSYVEEQTKQRLIELAVLANIVLIAIIIVVIVEDKRINNIADCISIFLAFNSFLIVLKQGYYLKIVGVIVLFLVIPFFKGVADIQTSITEKQFKMVKLGKSEQKWFLVNTFGDKAVLVDSYEKSRKVKVVEIKELDFVHTQ